jgi:bifunctional DNase/RNase
MKKIRLNILGLSSSQTQTGAYALILGEENGNRRLPVIIGTVEAQAIAIKLEGLKPYRPLTHDLVVSISSAFNITVTEVNIIKLEEGIYYSELVCERGNARIKIDSRTSDAIALALRFRCPIYATEAIMKKAALIFDDKTGKLIPSSEETNPEAEDETPITDLSIDELQTLMQEAIDNEDYEKASVYRDEITKRKK